MNKTNIEHLLLSQSVNIPFKMMIFTDYIRGADTEEMFAEVQKHLSFMRQIRIEVDLVEKFQKNVPVEVIGKTCKTRFFKQKTASNVQVVIPSGVQEVLTREIKFKMN